MGVHKCENFFYGAKQAFLSCSTRFQSWTYELVVRWHFLAREMYAHSSCVALVLSYSFSNFLIYLRFGAYFIIMGHDVTHVLLIE